MEHSIVIILFYLIILYIGYNEIKHIQITESKIDRKYLYAALGTLLFGCIIRTVYLTYPYGINVDEAMAAYDAWCLSNFGVDHHLMSYPLYFKSWGSGQNALYTYMMLPFIKIFGMHPYILRIPMALLSSSCILVLYFTIRKIKLNSFYIFTIILIFTLSPWHIIKSRWGLESNVAPDLILIATCLIICASVTKKYFKQTILYILAFVFLALSAYAYAVVWFTLPFYCLFIFIFLAKKHYIDFKQIIIASTIMLVIVTPLLIFVYIILAKESTISLGVFSIPELTKGRHEATTIFRMDLINILKYFLSTLKRLFTGNDENLWNSLPLSGQFFNPIGWIFIIIGGSFLIRKKNYNLLDIFFSLWLISSIPTIFAVEYNINRWNIIWFPLLYFCAKGLYIILDENKNRQVIFYSIFSILFLVFSFEYITKHSNGFRQEIGKHIEFIKTKDVDSVYYPGSIIEYSIIYFYDPISPYDLVKTQKIIPSDSSAFIAYASFGKYSTSLPKEIKPITKTAYIVPNSFLKDYGIDKTMFKIEEGEIYTTFWND